MPTEKELHDLQELRGLLYAIEARLRYRNISPESMTIITRQLGSAYRKAKKLAP